MDPPRPVRLGALRTVSQQIGIQPRAALDLFYLATNHECRTVEEQEALEVLALKLDRQSGFYDENGPCLRDARETLVICEEHVGVAGYAR